jgi:hypothetical protein
MRLALAIAIPIVANATMTALVIRRIQDAIRRDRAAIAARQTRTLPL